MKCLSFTDETCGSTPLSHSFFFFLQKNIGLDTPVVVIVSVCLVDTVYFFICIPRVPNSYVSRLSFCLWIYTRSVGLLEREIGPSQGLYLNTGQHKHRINAHTPKKHPCPKWDSNQRSQRPSERWQFMP
jgi:hypothetical protein